MLVFIDISVHIEISHYGKSVSFSHKFVKTFIYFPGNYIYFTLVRVDNGLLEAQGFKIVCS